MKIHDNATLVLWENLRLWRCSLHVAHSAVTAVGSFQIKWSFMLFQKRCPALSSAVEQTNKNWSDEFEFCVLSCEDLCSVFCFHLTNGRLCMTRWSWCYTCIVCRTVHADGVVNVNMYNVCCAYFQFRSRNMLHFIEAFKSNCFLSVAQFLNPVNEELDRCKEQSNDRLAFKDVIHFELFGSRWLSERHNCLMFGFYTFREQLLQICCCFWVGSSITFQSNF